MTTIGRSSLNQCWRCVKQEQKMIHSARTFSSSRPRQAISSKEEYASAKAYCSDLLRKSDSPSFTLLYCLPPHLQDFHIAVRALNVELARIPDTLSHPTVGTMRMQFWRQAINSTIDGSPPRGQPIAILLASAIEALSQRRNGQGPPQSMKSWFNRLIAARENRLTNPPFPNIAALESYAESTYSTLLYLTLSAIPTQSLTLDHLASHIGKAAGIIAILRGFPLIAFPPPTQSHHNNPAGTLLPGGGQPQGAITLPLDVLSQNSVQDEEIFRLGGAAPGLRDAVFQVATRASDHLITARTMLKNIRAGEDAGHAYEHEGEEGHEYDFSHNESNSSSTSPFSSHTMTPKEEVDSIPGALGTLMTGAIPTQLWLERLEQCDFDVFDKGLRRSDWKLPARTWWAWKQKMF